MPMGGLDSVSALSSGANNDGYEGNASND